MKAVWSEGELGSPQRKTQALISRRTWDGPQHSHPFPFATWLTVPQAKVIMETVTKCSTEKNLELALPLTGNALLCTFTGLCPFSFYIIGSLFISTFNTFSPSSLCKECLFYAGYIAVDTRPGITSPAPETTLKLGNLCFISHSTFGGVLILQPHQTQTETTTFTRRQVRFHPVPLYCFQNRKIALTFKEVFLVL